MRSVRACGSGSDAWTLYHWITPGGAKRLREWKSVDCSAWPPALRRRASILPTTCPPSGAALDCGGKFSTSRYPQIQSRIQHMTHPIASSASLEKSTKAEQTCHTITVVLWPCVWSCTHLFALKSTQVLHTHTHIDRDARAHTVTLCTNTLMRPHNRLPRFEPCFLSQP